MWAAVEAAGSHADKGRDRHLMWNTSTWVPGVSQSMGSRVAGPKYKKSSNWKRDWVILQRMRVALILPSTLSKEWRRLEIHVAPREMNFSCQVPCETEQWRKACCFVLVQCYFSLCVNSQWKASYCLFVGFDVDPYSHRFTLPFVCPIQDVLVSHQVLGMTEMLYFHFTYNYFTCKRFGLLLASILQVSCL